MDVKKDFEFHKSQYLWRRSRLVQQNVASQVVLRHNTLQQHGAPSHAKAFIQKLHDCCYSSYTRCFSFVTVSCILHYNSQRATSDFMSEVLTSANIRGKTARTSVLGGEIQTESVLWVPWMMLMLIHTDTSICHSVQSCRRIPKFRKNTLPSSSRFSEDEGSTFLWNFDAHLPVYTIKDKAIPLQVWGGPEGSRRLRLPDLKTIGTWRWQGCQPYAPAALTPRKYSWYQNSKDHNHSRT